VDVANLSPPHTENHLVQLLISEYLSHDGFSESAKVFAQEVNAEYSALQTAKNGNASSTVAGGKMLEVEEDLDATNRQRKCVNDCRT
jgi:hypothetical protein